LAAFGNVAGDNQDFGRPLRQIFLRGLKLSLVARAQNKPCAFPGESAGERQPQAPRSARDQNDLIRKVENAPLAPECGGDA
jgi:hypothetical protein